MDAATWGLVGAVFAACFVEMVEATTIVMAMGFTRGWRSVWIGVTAALLALTVFTLTVGYALASWLPESALQLVIGTLLLIFGLQWLRKAIYRYAGRKSIHDEEEIYREQVAAAESAGETGRRFDPFGFTLAFKAVFLEGVEVVFIVITFGLSADNVPAAAAAALISMTLVLVVAVAIRHPLSMVPENTLKYGVGLLLTAFGIYWAIEGMGVFRDDHASLEFPGADLAILVWLALAFVLTRVLIAVFRVPSQSADDQPTLSEVRS